MMGAALSSIGISLPSRAMSTVWFARPTMLARREDLLDRVLDGLPGHLVDDAEDLREGLAEGLPVGPAGERLRRPGS